ncbi:MAG: hypothetical protein KBT35_01580 [Firmicutes bacterium]|nr:hypothetical protein [Candidatus Colivicinus equi]
MAYMIQAKTEDELKGVTLTILKKDYIKLSEFYNKIMNHDVIYCSFCDDWISSNNFYTSKKTKDGINHCGCKSCLLDQATDFDKKTKIRLDNREKTINVFKLLDIPFIESVYKSQLQLLADDVAEKQRTTAYQQLLTLTRSLPQYKGKTFADSEFDVDSDQALEKEETKIIQKTLKSAKKRFGTNYNQEELMFLENEYQDWTNRYPCDNKSQELLFKRVCCKELEIDNAQKNGKDTKDMDATLQNLLGSLNIKPNQKTSSELTDNLTFGQLIDRWEQEKPIPEPEGEFKDPDKIGLLIDVFFKGHLSKMMGLKNAFSTTYEKFISKYTVKKPEYDEDTDSEALFDKIFGQKAEEEV